MSNYVKATNFTAKDSLPSGNSGKIIKGSEIDTELTAIASAISSKADTNSPALTGTPTAPTAAAPTNTTQIATTAFVTTAVAAATSALGTMSTQNASAVAITGGTIAGVTISGITDLTVADGGTGASSITANSIILGNGSSALNGNLVAPGSSGNILLSNGTTWTSATNTNFGAGQSWQNVTGSRATDQTYTNSTGRPIFVIAQVGAQTNGIYVYINGTLLVRHWYDVNGGAGQVGYSTAEFMVGNGDTYYVANGPLRQWWEFR